MFLDIKFDLISILVDKIMFIFITNFNRNMDIKYINLIELYKN